MRRHICLTKVEYFTDTDCHSGGIIVLTEMAGTTNPYQAGSVGLASSESARCRERQILCPAGRSLRGTTDLSSREGTRFARVWIESQRPVPDDDAVGVKATPT